MSWSLFWQYHPTFLAEKIKFRILFSGIIFWSITTNPVFLRMAGIDVLHPALSQCMFQVKIGVHPHALISHQFCFLIPAVFFSKHRYKIPNRFLFWNHRGTRWEFICCSAQNSADGHMFWSTVRKVVTTGHLAMVPTRHCTTAPFPQWYLKHLDFLSIHIESFSNYSVLMLLIPLVKTIGKDGLVQVVLMMILEKLLFTIPRWCLKWNSYLVPIMVHST